MFLLLFTLQPHHRIDTKGYSEYAVIQEGTLSYTMSSPIMITGDVDFVNQASANGWDGNGSLSSPFILRDLNITMSNNNQILVAISDTTVNFILEDSYLRGGLDCIRLVNVTNGQIVRTQILNASGNGVYLMQSILCTVDENSIQRNTDRGILIDNSLNCTISDNEVGYTSGNGINLRDSYNISISSNSIYNNSQYGLTLGRSFYCEIEGNMIHNNSQRGVSIESSVHTQITQNTISHNNGVGLSIEGPDTKVNGNTFYRNRQFGILVQSQGVDISMNNFIENGVAHPEILQVNSYVQNISLSHNFWDDWIVPDYNGDTIVDEPYTIRGVAENQDAFPHVFVYPNPDIHILTRPTPLFPNSTMETLYFHGMMNISWGPASDTFGHAITYSIQYSNDEAITWFDIAVGLTDTFYIWNTNLSAQNNKYTLRVLAVCSNKSSAEIFGYSSFVLREHVLTEPIIIVPASGDVISNRFMIQWTESIDSWDHNVTYSLYYSSDGGITWITIADIVRENQTLWYIGTLPDGQYTIKIVATSDCGLTNEYVIDGEFAIIQNSVKRLLYGSLIVGVIVLVCVVVVWYRRRVRM